MYRKTTLLLAFLAFLLTGCRVYDRGGTVTSENGLSCQLYTDYSGLGGGKQGAECTYICPDGTVSQTVIPEGFSTSSPLYTASKADLDARFCSLSTAQPPATETALGSSPTLAPTPTLETVPTTAVTAAESPLLAGDVTMCNMALRMINFRMIEPAPDLTGKRLVVQIADQDSICEVNEVNTSLLTCTIPPAVTFPAHVVATLDGVVVNDFIFDGLGCGRIATPLPSPAP